MTGIPVLTYHSLHAPGWSYAENDHTALAEDLPAIHRAGLKVLPLTAIIDHLLAGDRAWFDSGGKVGLSFDDGCNHDFIDFEYPGLPTLQSFHSILDAFNRKQALPQPACATSFVIASPVATAALDRTCIAGRGQWNSSWWPDAAASGLIAIGNHSWDHLHSSLPYVCHTRGARDDFSQVDNPQDAALQIEQAEDYIRAVVGEGHATGLFAYPDGRSNDWLVRHYFPGQKRIRAAFGTDPGHITADSDRWNLPRFVCGEHWRSVDELIALLQSPEERRT